MSGIFAPSPNVLAESQAYWASILNAVQTGGPLVPETAAATAVLQQVQLGLSSAQGEVASIDYELGNAVTAGTGAVTALQMVTALQAATDLSVQEAVLRFGIGFLSRIQTNLTEG